LIQLTEQQVERVLKELCDLELVEANEGNNRWKAVCCFHSEKTPSLKITKDGVFHCFGCQRSGNLIDLVHHVQACRHPKHAWRKILIHLGLEERKSAEKIPTLTEIQEYHRRLIENKDALKYLQEQRGLTVETILEWMLG